MATSKPWTDDEQRTICKAYAAMLVCEENGQPFNKAAIRRAILPELDGRSAGSYELKMCNISAALDKWARPYIKGYKPLAGYQRTLFKHVSMFLEYGGLSFGAALAHVRILEARGTKK